MSGKTDELEEYRREQAERSLEQCRRAREAAALAGKAYSISIFHEMRADGTVDCVIITTNAEVAAAAIIAVQELLGPLNGLGLSCGDPDCKECNAPTTADDLVGDATILAPPPRKDC